MRMPTVCARGRRTPRENESDLLTIPALGLGPFWGGINAQLTLIRLYVDGSMMPY